MREGDRPEDRHPLDPDPPRPPGVPDLDLDIPVGEDEEHKDAATEDTTGDVDKEPAEPPD